MSPTKPEPPLSGVLNLAKPPGPTSHDCVHRLRRLYGLKRIGHAGTLDPAARGVLLIALGRATRLLEYAANSEKVYRGEVVFGQVTDSYDDRGEIVAETPAAGLTTAEVQAALPAFLGEIAQVPPMASAKKVGGQKLYQLHRRGVEIERVAATVMIRAIDLLEFTSGEFPIARIEVSCGPGTYLRSLAHDLGQALGVGAHLRNLVRTRTGPFRLEQAVTLDELAELSPAERRARLAPPRCLTDSLPTVRLRPDALAHLVQGKALTAAELLDPAPPTATPVAVLSETGELLAVASPGEGGLRPKKVLLGPEDLPTTPE